MKLLFPPSRSERSSIRAKSSVLPWRKRGILMLYESTKTLLQSILLTLETGDESRWDDQIESGNACLYEMHQMSRPVYKAYRADANSVAQGSLPDKLNRAMPHVRLMV